MYPLFYILVVLVIVAAGLYLLNRAPGLDDAMKGFIRAVVIVFAVLFVLWEMLSIFGSGFHGFPGPCR